MFAGSRRLLWYVIIWASVTAVALTLRWTLLKGMSSEARVPLAFGYGGAIVALMVVIDSYERRRLARLCGLTGGRGIFQRMRGWMKTAAIEFAVDGKRIPPRAEREYLLAHRLLAFAFGALMIVVPLLIV